MADLGSLRGFLEDAHPISPRRLCGLCFSYPAVAAILVRILTIRVLLTNDGSRRAVQRRIAQYLPRLAPGVGPQAQILGPQPGKLDDYCGGGEGFDAPVAIRTRRSSRGRGGDHG